MKKMMQWMPASGTSVFTACSLKNNNSSQAVTETAIDYSVKANWLSLPKVTKDVDAFYIYSTAYIESSFEEDAPDYAPLNNPEMIIGALGEYETNASVFEESCNVFVPWYRQAGMKYAGEVSEKTGDVDSACRCVLHRYKSLARLLLREVQQRPSFYHRGS